MCCGATCRCSCFVADARSRKRGELSMSDMRSGLECAEAADVRALVWKIRPVVTPVFRPKTNARNAGQRFNGGASIGRRQAASTPVGDSLCRLPEAASECCCAARGADGLFNAGFRSHEPDAKRYV